MPACIIPIGPDWHDPDGTANYPPEIIDWNPPSGSIVMGANFSVTATDANVGDKLHFRWIADYPSTLPNNILQRDETKDGPVAPSSWNLNCAVDGLDPSLTYHRLTVIVADRPFTDNQSDIEEVYAPGRSVQSFWIWNVSCAPPLPPPESPTP